jgi:hypothetical protein
LRRALELPSGSPAGPGRASAPADRSYATLMHIHAETVERAERLSRLADWQGSRLRDIEGSASWRWSAPLRLVAERLRRRTPPA